MNRSKGAREFKTGAARQGYWHIQDLNEYFDQTEANAASTFNAKPSFTTLSLRLPEPLLDQLKVEADKREMPYQLLIQTWLAEAVEQSRRP